MTIAATQTAGRIGSSAARAYPPGLSLGLPEAAAVRLGGHAGGGCPGWGCVARGAARVGGCARAQARLAARVAHPCDPSLHTCLARAASPKQEMIEEILVRPGASAMWAAKPVCHNGCFRQQLEGSAAPHTSDQCGFLSWHCSDGNFKGGRLAVPQPRKRCALAVHKGRLKLLRAARQVAIRSVQRLQSRTAAIEAVARAAGRAAGAGGRTAAFVRSREPAADSTAESAACGR